MATVTYHVALAFMRSGDDDGGIVACDPKEARSSEQAIRLAHSLAKREGHCGAIAFSRTGDPALGDFEDAVILKTVGEVDTDSDLKDFMGAVAAIANDPDGKASIEAAYFEDGKKDIKAAIRFTTREAREAAENIEAHRRLLRETEHALHERVLMRFVQTNTKRPAMEKRTGERVIIEEIAKAERPLIYASELAERQIKHEMIEADENVYKNGFVVDVYIETKNGRPVAYKVTNLHQVIDLPDD